MEDISNSSNNLTNNAPAVIGVDSSESKIGFIPTTNGTVQNAYTTAVDNTPEYSKSSPSAKQQADDIKNDVPEAQVQEDGDSNTLQTDVDVHVEHENRTSPSVPALMREISVGPNRKSDTNTHENGVPVTRTKSVKKLTYKRDDDDDIDYIDIPMIQPKRASVIVRTRSYSFSRGRKLSAKFTKEQKVTLLCVCLVSFTANFSMSIIAPFFPKEASLKGMREAVSGFVFSVFALIMMIFCPLFGKLIPYAGAKFIFISGILFTGVSNILFGFLDLIDDLTVFTTMCFVVRIFEAIGAAAFTTSAFTYLMHLFPNHIGTAFGITETFVGLGMSLGPAAGGILYSVGGYGLPFYTLGVFVILNIPLCWYFLKPIEGATVIIDQNPKSYKNLISIPQVLMLLVVVVVASQGTAFLDPTLEPYLRLQFDFNAQVVGGLFLLLSVFYSLFSVFTGWLSGKLKNKYPIMIIGLLLMSIALVMIGPPSVIPIDESPWLSITGIALMGAAFALAYIPTFESILILALNHGFTESIEMYSLVSGLWSSMFSLGEVTGPSLGGVLSDILSFPIASSVMAGFAFGAAVLATIVCCCSKQKHPHARKVIKNGILPKHVGDLISKKNSDERTALLGTSSKTYGSSPNNGV